MSLFHYTDAESVHSILTHKKLWLTDIRFSNDSQELNDGIAKLSKALKTPMHGLFANPNYEGESIEYLQRKFADDPNLGLNDEPVFVCSFTSAENILSQWRAYGSYAIEFDERLLQKCVPPLRKCIYNENEKSDQAHIAITDALAAISQGMARSGEFDAISVTSLYKLIELAATFKHHGFEEEREVRIITQARVCDDSVKYRPKGNRLIPYREMDIPLDCIKSIHVGPMNEQELAYISMAAFVQKICIDWQSADSKNLGFNLGVKKSSIPYRAK
jgi:hypothetical protein